MPPPTCPNCGAYVPSNALACPDCGSDDSTGWNDRADEQSLGIDDDGFDYAEFIEKEFGTSTKSTVKVEGVSWFWWLVAFVALCLILSWFL
ncbi:MAG: hypothetical protein CMO80_11750 [Verrucomicrobiales bacterium]|nr:hypothetical protein [Verrucomicrobiales bacterium]